MAGAEKAEVVYRPAHAHDVVVTLTAGEYQRAVEHGRWLYRRAQSNGYQDYHAAPHFTGEHIQIRGALGESAAAKALGLTWGQTRNSFRGPDLPGNIEVRTVAGEHYGVRVYEHDDDARRVVLVVIPRGAERGPYRVVGWINARHAKRPAWRLDPFGGRPFYAVPQDRLHSLAVLRALLIRDGELEIGAC